MKISALHFLSFLATATAGAGAETPTTEYHPVSIHVHCKGIDFKSLSVVEDEFSAGVLMDAYNMAHQAIDSGDKFLSQVHFEGITNMGLEDSSAVEDDDDEDLEEGVSRGTKPKYTALYNGGAGCRYCAPDAAVAMFVELGRQAPSLVAWEKEFKDLLKQGPHSALHGVKKCDISMSIQENAGAEVAETTEESVGLDDAPSVVTATNSQHNNVSIAVHCKGVDWEGLTVQEDDFSAKVLMEAYNIVHQEFDGGDKYLDTVHFEACTDMGLADSAEEDDEDLEEGVSRGTKPKYTALYNGGAGCRYCAPDASAAAMMFVDVLGRPRSVVAWQNKFEAMLKEGPHSALFGAKKCKINLTTIPTEAVAVAAVTVNDATKNAAATSSLRGFAIQASTSTKMVE